MLLLLGETLAQHAPEGLVHFAELLDGAVLDERLCELQRVDDVVHQATTVFLIQHLNGMMKKLQRRGPRSAYLLPERARLRVVVVVAIVESSDVTRYAESMPCHVLALVLGSVERVGVVVRCTS